MKTLTKKLAAACIVAGLPAIAHAIPVQVEVKGVVDFNVIGGSMADVQDGDPVVMRFNVDSDVFEDSPNFPTRGYNMDLASFEMTVGGRPVIMDDPQPAYFVLRDNDPVVDGFFISPGLELPFPLSVHIPGLTPAHELDFLVTYDDGTTLNSLNILDAAGIYTFEGISVYNWGIGRFGNHGAEYVYGSLEITPISVPVPEPAALSMLGLGLLVVLGRTAASRRKSGRA